MSGIFSNKCEYGLRAAVYIAALKKDQFVSIRSVAEALDISFYFLTKVLQTLTQANIMNSYRGPNGGISLSRPASDIRLSEIVIALEGRKSLEGCVLGLPECGGENPCPLHNRWMDIREEINRMLGSTTLQELADQHPVNRENFIKSVG